MCNQITTSEGLIVCENGDVVGVDFDNTTSTAEVFKLTIHGLFVDIKRPAGKIRDRVKVTKFTKTEYMLVKALSRVNELVKLLELPQIVASDASVIVRKLYSSNLSSMEDCMIIATIMHVATLRGFHVPQLIYEVTKCPKDEITSQLYYLHRILNTAHRHVSLLEIVEKRIEELCSSIKCHDVKLAKKFVRRLYEVDRTIVQSFTPTTVAQIAVYLASRLHGMKAPKSYLSQYTRMSRKLSRRGLVVEVRLKCS